jgi:hypothetical protein
MPKLLGVVAAGFLALGMGAGVAGAGQMPTTHPTSNPTHGISQMGSNVNDTYQKARSHAETNQKNVNKPFSFFTVGSNDGNVQQWNKAETESAAVNRNWTNQNVAQGQHVTSPQKSSDCGCKQGDEKHHKHHRRDQNGNSTKQHASSSAETNQVNVNAPISAFSVGSNDGSVQQGNAANTNSVAANGNSTGQFLGQGQLVGGLLG